MSLIAALVLALAVLTGGTAATVYAADQAVPGDALYAVDLTVEQIQLALARDPATKAQLHLRFAEERVAEIQALALQGNTTAVAEAAQNLEQHLTAAQELLQQAPAPEVAQQMSTVMEEAQAVLEQPLPGASATAQATPTGTPEPHGTPAPYMEFTGTVESMDGNQWVVSGQAITIDANTRIKGSIQVGDTVKVKAYTQADGSLLAHEIERTDYASDDDSGQYEGQKVKFTGTVESMDGNQWVVDGKTITVDTNTRIKGSIQVGDTVKVEAYVQADGSLLAHEIEQASAESSGDTSDDESDSDSDHDGDEDSDSGDSDSGSGDSDSGGSDSGSGDSDSDSGSGDSGSGDSDSGSGDSDSDDDSGSSDDSHSDDNGDHDDDDDDDHDD